jgi:hypothetical protein
MSVTTQQRSEWSTLTDRLSADHAGHDVTIEVLDPEGAANPMVERLPFESITYDPRDDVLVVTVGGRGPRFPVALRHLIQHPQEILFDLTHHGAALKVTDPSGTATLISLVRRGPADRGDA